MNHPKLEEWLPYLEGEAAPEITGRLSEHLKECPQCAAEIQGWRRTIGKLEALPWPKARPAWRNWTAPVVKWAAAAVIMLALGFAGGRVSAFNSKALRASLANELRAELRQDLKADLAAAVSPDEQAAKDGFQKQLRAGFQAALVQNANASTAERQRLVQDILRVVGAKQEEDRRDIQTLFLGLQQREAYDLVLRRDLENVAATADDRLQQAHWQLTQLAVDTHPNRNH